MSVIASHYGGGYMSHLVVKRLLMVMQGCGVSLKVQKGFCWLLVWEGMQKAFDGVLVMQYVASDE